MTSYQRLNIAFITNGISPYRINLFKKLYVELSSCNINLFVYSMTKREPNRDWDFDSLKTQFTKLIFGFSLNFKNYYLHFNPFIIRVIRKDDIKLVVFTGSYITPTLLLLIIYRWLRGIKIIFWSESHLDEYRDYNSVILWIRRKYRYWVYKKFDGFISPGERANKFILAFNSNNSPIHHHPNTINDMYFREKSISNNQRMDEIKAKHNINNGNKNLFIVARLHKSKGLLEFLELLNLSKYKKILTIHIAGEGELKQDLIRVAIEYKLNLRLLGQVNEMILSEFLAICDFFTLPSLSDPSPLSVVEALWSSRPLLLSNRVGNLNEALEEGINGYSFDVLRLDDVKVIDNAIENTNEWFKTARARSLEIAKTKFNSTLEVNKLSKYIVSNLRDTL